MKKITIPLLLLTIILFSCRRENKMPQWDTEVLTPLLKTSLSIENIIADSLLVTNNDSSLKLVYENQLYSIPLDSILVLPDTSVTTSIKLDSIKLPNKTLSFPISLGEIAPWLGPFNGQTLSVPANNNLNSNPFPIDAQAFFQTVTLLSGFMDMSIYNGFPVDIKDLVFRLTNESNGSLVAQDTFPFIATHTSQAKTISLAGKTVEGKMVAEILAVSSMASNGPVLIDTSNTIVTTVTVHDLHPFTATAIFPSQNIVDQKGILPLHLKNVFLTQAKIKSGFVKMDVYCTMQDSIKFHYELPSAKLNGVPYVVNTVLPPAPVNGVSVFSKLYDMSGYDLDLTGEKGDTVNTAYNLLIGSIDSTGIIKTISLADSFHLEMGFVSMIPDYARGYLGQTKLDAGSKEFPLDLFNKVTGGTLNLESLKMSVTIENGIGVDAKVNIKNITSVNSKKGSSVALSGPAINNSINVMRATQNFSLSPPVQPSYTIYQLDNSNSTVKSLIENLPDKLLYSIHIETNPKGNVTGGNDFLYASSGLKTKLNMEMPLSFISNKLSMEDTSDFALDKPGILEKVKSGTFTLIAENGFPFEANIQLYLVNSGGTIIDSLFVPGTISAAPVDNNLRVLSPKSSKLTIPFSEAKLSQLLKTKKMLIRSNFTTMPTAQLLKIYSSYSLKLKLTGDFNYRVE